MLCRHLHSTLLLGSRVSSDSSLGACKSSFNHSQIAARPGRPYCGWEGGLIWHIPGFNVKS